jgi:site-specific recombinase XerD
MFDKEDNPRNFALLRVLYSSGCRISEVLNLQWRDVVWNETSGAKITVLGKGSKIRTVNIYGASVEALRAMRWQGAFSLRVPLRVRLRVRRRSKSSAHCQCR